MQVLITILYVLVFVCLVACSPTDTPKQVTTHEPVSRITGEQLERVRQQVNELRRLERKYDLEELPTALWSSVHWINNETGIIVHVRIDGLEDSALHDKYCDRLQKLIRAEFQPGQSFDIYTIGSDNVQKCA
jgi:hypothetical protein